MPSISWCCLSERGVKATMSLRPTIETGKKTTEYLLQKDKDTNISLLGFMAGSTLGETHSILDVFGED